jgi:hypothetical protein
MSTTQTRTPGGEGKARRLLPSPTGVTGTSSTAMASCPTGSCVAALPIAVSSHQSGLRLQTVPSHVATHKRILLAGDINLI